MSQTATDTNVSTIYRGDDTLRGHISDAMRADSTLTQSRVSKEAGVSSATLSQWLGGTYKGNNESIDTKMRMWLESHQARVAAGEQLPTAPSFVHTPTAKRIVAALNYAQVAEDIAVIYGAAGVSKSSTLRHYRDNWPNVWLVTMKPATSGVVPALEEICEAMNLSASGGARRMSREITKRVAGTHGLLLIDEAQHLSVAALDQIRSIHDDTSIGIALVGNTGVFSRMAGGRNADQLDRLYSRIGKRLKLDRATDGDINALIDAWGVTDAKCKPTLMEIARRPGALRTFTKVLRLASMSAAAEGRPVCCEDVKAASRELGGAH